MPGSVTKSDVRQVIERTRIHKTVNVETLLSNSLGASYFLSISEDIL